MSDEIAAALAPDPEAESWIAQVAELLPADPHPRRPTTTEAYAAYASGVSARRFAAQYSPPPPPLPPHPGEVLRREYLEPLGLTSAALADALGVARQVVAEVLAGDRRLGAHVALLLGRYLGTTPERWLVLQQTRDLEEARRDYAELLASVAPSAELARRAAETPASHDPSLDS